MKKKPGLFIAISEKVTTKIFILFIYLDKDLTNFLANVRFVLQIKIINFSDSNTFFLFALRQKKKLNGNSDSPDFN